MIRTHKGAFEHDWRHRFHVPLTAIGSSMSWGEAVRLTGKLASNPESEVAASLAGWSYAASWDALVAMDHYDLTHQIAWAQGGGKGGKPKPYPRPWSVEPSSRIKPGDDITHEQVVAALRRAGHTAPIPARP